MHALREFLDQLVELLQIARGDVAVDPADAQVVGVHARAAGEFHQVEHVLANVEDIPEGRDRTEVDAVRAEPHAVRGDARQLGHEHANGLRPRRNPIGDAQQLLGREHVAQRVADRIEVVHPLDDRLRLRPEKVFGRLLDAGVEIADLHLGALDRLARNLDHDLQHAVRRGMLRPAGTLLFNANAGRGVASRAGPRNG